MKAGDMSVNKLKTFAELKDISTTERKKQKTIGLIAGCFDILHLGHIHLFREAKKLVDILIIELENDENIKTLKGQNRPINTAEYRANFLSEITSIDYIFIVDRTFKQDSAEAAHYYEQLIVDLKPQYIFLSAKQDKYKEQKQRSAHKSGSQYVEIEPLRIMSTTEILNKLTGLG